MLKCSLKRCVLRNRGVLFNTLCDNSFVWRNDKVSPKITSFLYKAPQGKFKKNSLLTILSIITMYYISKMEVVHM